MANALDPGVEFQVLDHTRQYWKSLPDALSAEMEKSLAAKHPMTIAVHGYASTLFNPMLMMIDGGLPVRRVAANTAKHQQFAWWSNEEGRIPYGLEEDKFIEHVFNIGGDTTALYLNGQVYDIDFVMMKQTNRNTGMERDIVLRAREPAGSDQLTPVDFSGIAEADIPTAFVCNLTQEPFKCPVVGSDGITYELKPFLKWINMCIEKNQPVVSPLTKKPMKGEVYLNLTLYRAMTAFYLLQKDIEKMIKKSAKEKAQEAYDAANSSSSPLKAPGAPKKTTPVVSRLESDPTEEEDAEKVRQKRLRRFGPQ